MSKINYKFLYNARRQLSYKLKHKVPYMMFERALKKYISSEYKTNFILKYERLLEQDKKEKEDEFSIGSNKAKKLLKLHNLIIPEKFREINLDYKNKNLQNFSYNLISMVNKQLIKLREFKSMIKTQTMSKDITFAFKKIFFEELSQGVYESFDAEDTSHSNYFIGIQHTLIRIMPNLIVDVETAKVYGNIIKLLNWQSATEFHFTFEDRSLLKKLQGSSKQEWTHSSIPHILRSTHFHYFYKHLINKLKFSDVKILYQQFQQEPMILLIIHLMVILVTRY
jgi:hypothetical protein